MCVVHASACSGLLTHKHAYGGGKRISRICFLPKTRVFELQDLHCRYAGWPVRPRKLLASTSGAGYRHMHRAWLLRECYGFERISSHLQSKGSY